MKTIDFVVAQPQQAAPVIAPKIDRLGRAYGTGRRKEAVACVWIKPGNGKIVVNDKPFDEYFSRPVSRAIVMQLFQRLNIENKYDIMCSTNGGGLSGQAGALRLGIARALLAYDPDFRPRLRLHGFLTRDSRTVERKKYGLAKARKAFQFSKR